MGHVLIKLKVSIPPMIIPSTSDCMSQPFLRRLVESTLFPIVVRTLQETYWDDLLSPESTVKGKSVVQALSITQQRRSA